MKTEIDYDAIENATSKITTGFRCEPELKLQLADEATELGISLSEHLENVISNRNKSISENAQLRNEIERLKSQHVAHDTQLSASIKSENEILKKKVEALNHQLGIYRDARLLYIFENVKGQKDTVENAYGNNFEITYQSPHEVLLAIIYNTKLKQ